MFGSLVRLGVEIAKHTRCMRHYYFTSPKQLNKRNYAIRAACALGRLHNETNTCNEASCGCVPLTRTTRTVSVAYWRSLTQCNLNGLFELDEIIENQLRSGEASTLSSVKVQHSINSCNEAVKKFSNQFKF